MSPEELIEIATNGKSIAERINALTAMIAQKDLAPFVGTIKGALYEEIEGSPAVRMQALRTIRCRPDIIEHEPYIIEMLEWVEDNDESEYVRQTAKDALKAFRAPRPPICAHHKKSDLTTVDKATLSYNIGAPFGAATFASIIEHDKKDCWRDSTRHPLFGSNWVIEKSPPEDTPAAKPVEENKTTMLYPKWMPPSPEDFEPE